MSRIVMKFGGTSVGSIDRIQNVSNIVKSVYDEGHEVVVVLSAMAGETDRLINLTKDISDMSKRLENKDFLNKAPKSVVEENLQKLDDMKVDNQRIKSSRVLIEKLIINNE